LDRIWKDAVIAYFKTISKYLSGEPRENHGSLLEIQNQGPPDIKQI
jgi:hypothetical protein